MFNQDSSEKRGLCSTFRPREMLQNLLCLWIKKMQVVLFCFSFRATLSSTLMNALVYVDIHQGIYKGKTQSCLKWKMKKTSWVFFFHKYSQFWNVSLGQKVERKPLFSEECPLYYLVDLAGNLILCISSTTTRAILYVSTNSAYLSKNIPSTICLVSNHDRWLEIWNSPF